MRRFFRFFFIVLILLLAESRSVGGMQSAWNKVKSGLTRLARQQWQARAGFSTSRNPPSNQLPSKPKLKLPDYSKYLPGNQNQKAVLDSDSDIAANLGITVAQWKALKSQTYNDEDKEVVSVKKGSENGDDAAQEVADTFKIPFDDSKLITTPNEENGGAMGPGVIYSYVLGPWLKCPNGQIVKIGMTMNLPQRMKNAVSKTSGYAETGAETGWMDAYLKGSASKLIEQSANHAPLQFFPVSGDRNAVRAAEKQLFDAFRALNNKFVTELTKEMAIAFMKEQHGVTEAKAIRVLKAIGGFTELLCISNDVFNALETAMANHKGPWTMQDAISVLKTFH